MKNNFIQRAVTGALFVVILVGCILYSPLSFGILFTIIGALSVHEFAHLVNRNGGVSINKTITALGGAYLFLALMGFCTSAIDARVFLPYLGLLLYLMITELYLKKENPIGNWAYAMLSQLYVALPFALLNVLAFQNSPETSSVTYNPILPLSIFVFIWLSDTGAYCVGSLIGKHRLFERISPKKSWEGSIGGAFFSIASSFVFAHFFPFMSTWQWAHLGRPHRIADEASTGHQGFRQHSSGTRRNARPVRQRSHGNSRSGSLPVCNDNDLTGNLKRI